MGFEAIRGWKCIAADSGKDLGVEIRKFFIPDFTNWKDHDAFEAAFARLIEDLKAETPPTGGPPRNANPQAGAHPFRLKAT